jgi:hypothetical protein
MSSHVLVGSENELTLRSLEDETEVSYYDGNFHDTVKASGLKKKKTLTDQIPLFTPHGSFH